MTVQPAPSSPPLSRDWKGAFAVVITVIAWASSFPAIRAGLSAFGPVELGAFRFAVAAVPAALYLALTRPVRPTWRECCRLAAGGVFSVAIYTALLNIGELTVSAGAASFIINVNPIITAAFAMWLLGERFSALGWAGTAVSFFGIGLIALGESGGFNLSLGALLILGAALSTSVGTVAQKPLFTRHKPLTVAAWNMVVGALCLSPALPRALDQALLAEPGTLFAALYLGLVPSLVAYGTWAVVLSRMPASRASNFMYCVPPVATAMGTFVLGEVPTRLGVVGGALALAGVALVNLQRRPFNRLG